jgi:hypothetical protein
MRFIATIIVIGGILLCQSVVAYPSGAGGCTAGNTAVQSLHLAPESGTIVTGSLANGGFTVSLDGAKLIADSTYTFSTYTDTALTITGTTKTFRGFLVRLGETGGVYTDSALSGNTTDVSGRSYSVSVPVLQASGE